MKEGDIILLTSRELSWNPRSWLTKIIENLTGKFIHTGIIFKYLDELWIREMEYEGVRITKLENYLKNYYSRIWIMSPKESLQIKEIIHLNLLCLNEKAKYDYFNLIVWQLIKAFTSKFIGRNTAYRRNCSEDTARIYNKVRSNTFDKEM